jgi:hypothetical protein
MYPSHNGGGGFTSQRIETFTGRGHCDARFGSDAARLSVVLPPGRVSVSVPAGDDVGDRGGRGTVIDTLPARASCRSHAAVAHLGCRPARASSIHHQRRESVCQRTHDRALRGSTVTIDSDTAQRTSTRERGSRRALRCPNRAFPPV